MKNIKFLLTIAMFVCLFASCTDTKDCKCEVEVPNKSTIQKLRKIIDFKDWDTDCSNISTKDLEEGQFLINPCKEI
ncbi:MAG: hypothetical protein ACTTJH_05385 [Bacteroidales bacterium]